MNYIEATEAGTWNGYRSKQKIKEKKLKKETWKGFACLNWINHRRLQQRNHGQSEWEVEVRRLSQRYWHVREHPRLSSLLFSSLLFNLFVRGHVTCHQSALAGWSVWWLHTRLSRTETCSFKVCLVEVECWTGNGARIYKLFRNPLVMFWSNIIYFLPFFRI